MKKKSLLNVSRSMCFLALLTVTMSLKAQTNIGVIEFTTEKGINEEITFAVSTISDEGSVSIEGAEGVWINDKSVTYKLTSETVKLTGDINAFKCKKGRIKTLNISGCPELKSLDVNENAIETLDLSNNEKLKKLAFQENKISSLNLKSCPNLQWIECAYNKMETLDISENTELDWLNCSGNLFKELDLKNNTKLTGLLCSNMQLENLDVSMCEEMERILCQNNKIGKLDVSKNKKLKRLQCFGNKLEELNISNNIELTSLNCSYNNLRSLDVSANKHLSNLSCTNNNLTSLNVEACEELSYLYCSKNEIKGIETDKLIASLRNITGEENKGLLCIIDNTAETDNNVCTKEQVEKAKQRGWIAQERKEKKWIDYEGSETDDINTLLLNDESNIEAVYDISGKRMEGPANGIVIVKMKDGKRVKIIRK